MLMFNFFTRKSILVDTYDNNVSDYTQELTQKKVLCMLEEKCHHMVCGKYKKSRLLGDFLTPGIGAFFIFLKPSSAFVLV